MSRKNWERVQKIEQAYHEAKDADSIREVNEIYFQRLFAASEIEVEDDTRMLDVGCGGCGILIAVPRGQKIGIDPLMPYYLEKFPYLKDLPVDWREGMAEDLSSDEPFDVIFSINMLDHVADPAESARNFEAMLKPGGKMVLLLNTHLSRASRRYFELFYRFIDPPHAHHWHRDDVPGLFPTLKETLRRDVDDLWLDLKRGYDRDIRGRNRWVELKRLLKKLVNPFKYPLAAWRFFLNKPVFRKRPEENPLIAAHLYVFVKPA